MTMTLGEAREILKNISYRPDWEIDMVFPPDTLSYRGQFRIIAKVQDSRNPYIRDYEKAYALPSPIYWKGEGSEEEEDLLSYIPDRKPGYPQKPNIVDVVSYSPCPPLEMLDGKLLVQEAARAFQKFELHESDEWFRYKGELINDPHANDIK